MATAPKSVLITGCSIGGIGGALARQFHEQGLHVFATSRTLDSMECLSTLGIKTLALNVTDLNAIRRVRSQVEEITRGKLDVLVKNTGQAYPVAATDFDMSEVRALFEVNIFAAMVMVREFVHMLIASGNGRIFQTGSLSGIMPIPFSAACNASKDLNETLSHVRVCIELDPAHKIMPSLSLRNSPINHSNSCMLTISSDTRRKSRELGAPELSLYHF